MTDHDTVSNVMNVAAPATIIGTLIGWLPSFAAALGVIWYCILLYDRFIGKKND